MAQYTRRRDAISWPEADELGTRADYKRTFETLQGSAPIETVTIGGKTYRQDNTDGQNKLMAVGPSDAELEERRRAGARIEATLNNPLGAAAYGIAAALGASPRSRDMALAAGSIADGLMMGVAPRGAAPMRLAPEFRREPPRVATRSEIRLRDANSIDQAQGFDATVGSRMLGTGTAVPERIQPPGWVRTYKGQDSGLGYDQSRGHLLAKSLGGDGKNPLNVVTLAQNPTNVPWMSGFEKNVADRVRQGEFVEYSAIPLYSPGVLPPEAVLLTATGPRQSPTARVIYNPAGRRP
jgi:hypothetical protein